MYMGLVRCGTRKSGKTPPFSPIFQPICMQMCPANVPLHMPRERKASKHTQSKLLNFLPVLPGFYLRSTLGLYFVVTIALFFLIEYIYFCISKILHQPPSLFQRILIFPWDPTSLR